MSVAAAPLPRLPRRSLASLGFLLVLVSGGGVIAASLAIGAGSPALVLAPPALAGVVWVVTRLPLRITATSLVFVVLSLETSTDAAGLWHTPLAGLGDLLRDNLDVTLGLPGAKFPGIEIVLLFLLGLSAWRKSVGSTIDTAGQLPTPRVIRDAVLVFLAAILFMFANGLATGGSVELWQLRRFAQIPLYFAVFQAAFRGPRDHELIGRAIVAAGCVKGVLAAVAQRVAVARTGGELAHATNHGDSILFAVGVSIVVLHVLERPDRARILRAALPLALLLLGIKENNRRIAFVELGMGLGAAYLLAPAVRWKRQILRATAVALPVVLLYVAAGWSSTSGRFFGPARTLRSLVDSETNQSTAWRDVENWNIAMSMRERPLLGIGLGKGYTEHASNYDISVFYREYRLWPHNSSLGLLLFGGILAFSAMRFLPAVGILLAVRSIHRARTAVDRTAALCVVSAVIACTVQEFGDLGAAFTQFRLLEGLALAVAGKLAVATGAWPAPGANLPAAGSSGP